MADLFGDNALFSEFEKDRTDCDKILKLSCEEQQSVKRGPYKTGGNYSANSELTHGSNPVRQTGFGDDQPGKNETTEKHRCTEEHQSGDTNKSEYIRSLENEVERLKSINAQLVSASTRIKSKWIAESLNAEPCMHILYMNHAVARRHKAELEEFLSSKLKKEEVLSKTSGNRLPILPNRPNYVNLGQKTTIDFGSPADSHTLIASCTYFDCFIIDCVGWPLIEYNPSLSDSWVIPVYEQVFFEPLPCDVEQETVKEARKDRRPKRSCFNCGGEHTLSECKEKRDHRRIAENRQQFQQQCPTANTQNLRYHDDEPQFPGMKAGIISENLRAALGISNNQLPPYIYQMRVFGYPPGYLEEACQQTSGLSMFGKHGREIKKDGALLEDGEVHEDGTPTVAYDLSKLVDYPGFNVEPDPGTIDEFERFNMPPMQPHQSKDLMKGSLVKKVEVGSKRRSVDQSLEYGVPAKIKRIDNDSLSHDMDLEESAHEDDSEVTSEETSQEVLIDSSSTPQVVSSSDSRPDSEQANFAGFSTPVCVTPVSRCESVGFTLGTPLALDISETEGESSVQKLPDRSLFSVGVSDHILYENLPNATGTFQRLRDVMRQMRESGQLQQRPGTVRSTNTTPNSSQSQ